MDDTYPIRMKAVKSYGCLPIIIVGIVIMCFGGCSTLHKTKSIFEAKTNKDSTVTSHVTKDSLVDSSHLRKDKEITAITNTNEETVETKIKLKPTLTDTAILDGIYNRGSVRSDDFFSTDGLNKFLNDHAKDITGISQKVTKKKADNTTTTKEVSDSGHKLIAIHESKDDSTHAQTQQESISTNKIVDRSSFNWWLLLWLIPIILAIRYSKVIWEFITFNK